MSRTDGFQGIGRLFALGSNGSGQLGLGHHKDVSKPLQAACATLEQGGSVKQLAAGGNHTLILYNDGSLKAMGFDADGRCGLGSSQSWNEPAEAFHELSHQHFKILYVSATWSASMIACSNGAVFTCGTGESGELGLGKSLTVAKSAQQIANFPPGGTRVVQLASCMAHTLAVLSNGEVYGWGKGRKGQLGEPGEGVVWLPRRIEGIGFPVARAVGGKEFTCLVGSRETGEVLVLGPEGNDRFGIRANAPAAVPDWVDVVASWGSIYVLRKDGSILAWGRDDHGQLPPSDLPSIQAVAAGSEHCLALSRAGRVLAWGWGEHGNCGEPTDERGDVRDRWNQLEVPGTVRCIFAGCATSFVSNSAG